MSSLVSPLRVCPIVNGFSRNNPEFSRQTYAENVSACKPQLVVGIYIYGELATKIVAELNMYMRQDSNYGRLGNLVTF